MRVDVVGEREDRLLVGGVPLHRDLDVPLVGLALEEHDLLADRLLVLVEVGDEVGDAALVLEDDGLALGTLVGQRDLEAAREEGRLAQALLEDRVVELGRLEDRAVGQEGDRGAGALLLGELPALLDLGLRHAALVLLRPFVPVTADREAQLVAEGVDHRGADAVEATGDLVPAAVAELAAGVQDGEHDLDRGLLLLLHLGHGDAAAVVGDGDGVVRVDRDRHGRAEAGQGLVDRVVHDLVHEVMQTADARRSDVHAGPFAYGLETLQDGDVLRVVVGRALPAVAGGGVAGQESSGRQEKAPVPGQETSVRGWSNWET